MSTQVRDATAAAVKEAAGRPANLWILKPVGLSRGRGIVMVRARW